MPNPSESSHRAASRLSGLGASPIRRLSEGAPEDAIPLGLGEPTWDLPEPARRALAASSAIGACAYGPNAGLPELRAAVAAFHGVESEEVLITVGSTGALHALFLAFVDPGDCVLLPDPGYPAYAALARLAGASPRAYGLGEGWRLDAARFRTALEAGPRPRLAVINVPSNPTGGGVDLATLEAIARACAERGVLLVSDEVYRELYLGDRSPSLRDVSRDGVVLGSVSKAWGAPGLRVGWAIGDPAVLGAARIVHGYSATAAARPAQRAALALLEASDEVCAASRREVGTRWQALREATLAAWGSEAPAPDGAFYSFLPLPPGAGEPALRDPWSFCMRLRDEARVVVVPGEVFGPAGRGHVRLSFAASPEQIREGVRRLAPFFAARASAVDA